MAFLGLPSNYDELIGGFWKEMKRLFPCGQGLPQEDEDKAYRERPKGKLPFHSHILIHCYMGFDIKDT